MKKGIRIAIGAVISAVCLWFTFRGFDFSALREQTTHFKLIWLLPTIIIFTLSFAMRSMRWLWILSSIRPMPFRTVASALIFGFLMNSILPARGGEVARSFAIARKGGIPVSSALGSVVAERTMDLFGLMGIMLVAARLLPWDKLPVAPIAGTVAALLVAMLVASFVIPKLPIGKSVRGQKIKAFILQLGAGFAVIRQPSKVIGLIAVSLGIWTLDALVVLSLSRAAGLALNFSQSAALNVGIAVGVMIPAAPGYVGTYEFFGKQALMMMGFAGAPALTFVVFLHFFQMAMIVVVLGIPSMLWLGVQPDVAPAIVPATKP